MVRYTVWFEGNVQGVGFRYTTVQTARGFSVNGYVQNLDDGRVLLVAEGSDETVREFVEQVQDRLSRHIRRRTVEKASASGGHDGFSIRH